jgi:hypothetical protein
MTIQGERDDPGLNGIQGLLWRLMSIYCLTSFFLAGGQANASFQSSSAQVNTPKGQSQLPTRPAHPLEKHVGEMGQKSRAASAVPTRARITFQGGLLTIHAADADLAEILHQVANASGMVIDGLIKSSRVYGDFGPGDPWNVLTDLLAGTGYNFMMVGSTVEGTPRELLLTQKSGEPLPKPRPRQNGEDLHEESVEPVGPGAIQNVPPPPSEDPQVRMQQNLQRLQQMHDHQTEPNQPQ